MLTPCYRFTDISVTDQIEKVRGELAEIDDAYKRCMESDDAAERVSMMMEVVDVQVACETLLYILGAEKKEEREAVRRLVYEKNRLRGYYDR